MDMQTSAQTFYDGLSADYHLIAVGWDEAVRTQGQTLHKFLSQVTDKNRTQDILDCSCGIGTQAIGLALQGNKVVGSDISPKAVERAVAESKRLGARAEFMVADFRSLDQDVPGQFDIVLSCDNSVPHLMSVEDLELAAKNMFSKVRPGGTVAVSTRDYDQIRKEKPTGMPPRKICDQHGKRVYFQTWDWNPAGDAYDLELFLVRQNAGTWEVTSHTTTYRAWLRSELQQSFAKAGFTDLKWWMPDESGYYQPILTGLRAT